jgi:hypothetical protein
MRRLILCAMAGLLSVAAPAVAQTAGQQPSCAAGDPIVWGNADSKVYHLQGDKYYGNTKHGAYLCESKADAAGYRASKSSGKPAQSAPAGGAATALPGASPSAKHHRGLFGAPAGTATALPGTATPLPGASPIGKHRHRHTGGAPSAMGTPLPGAATPLPGASPSGKRHHHHKGLAPDGSATALPGAAAPLPGASASAKHHHHKGASPSPSAT